MIIRMMYRKIASSTKLSSATNIKLKPLMVRRENSQKPWNLGQSSRREIVRPHARHIFPA